MSDTAPAPAEPRAPRPFAKTEQVLTTLMPATRERLDRYATSAQVSRAEAMRTFIIDGLDREELRAEAGLKP